MKRPHACSSGGLRTTPLKLTHAFITNRLKARPNENRHKLSLLEGECGGGGEGGQENGFRDVLQVRLGMELEITG